MELSDIVDPYAILFVLHIILYSCLVFTILVILTCILFIFNTMPYPEIYRFEEEESYYDPKTKSNVIFPQISDPPSVDLSVIVPAYNEELRLPPMLDETLEFLEMRIKQNAGYNYEVIVVSDGSTDKTVEVAQSYSDKYGSDKVKCLKLIQNRGKGGAVQLGVQSARGAVILFADADGATKFEDLTKLETALKYLLKLDPVKESDCVSDAIGIVIGSRAHLEQESLANRTLFRNILMYGFHFLVWLFTVRGIKDTQCGFKLFTRKTANICFQSLHVKRWAFDVELLYIAQKLNIPIVEIPVRWIEIDGSKVTPVISWIQMGVDLGIIWIRYMTGRWKIKGENFE